MGKAFSVTWKGIVDTYSELFTMIGMNLVWFALSIVVGIPSFFVLLIAFSWAVPSSASGPEGLDAAAWLASIAVLILLAVAPTPAAAGLHNYANQMVKEERVEFGLFWEGLRRYWAKALALYAISLGGIILLVANLFFYLRSASFVLQLIGILWGYVILIWLSMQMYVMPLLVEQDVKRVWPTLRNAALIALDNPFFTLILLVLSVVLTLVSTGLSIFLVLISGSLVVMVQHRAVLTLLEKYRKRDATKPDGKSG